MKFVLVVIFGLSHGGSAAMLPFDSKLECEAARTAIISEHLTSFERDNGNQAIRDLTKSKCVAYSPPPAHGPY